jgi:hypothetical protein
VGSAQQNSEDAALNRALDDLSLLRDQLAYLGGRSNSQLGQGHPGQSGQQQAQNGRSGQRDLQGGQRAGDQQQRGQAGGGQSGAGGNRLAGLWGSMPLTTGGAVWRSAAIGCIALTLAACLTEQKREGEKNAVGELIINVNKRSNGEGYTPPWAPSTDENTPLAIGLDINANKKGDDQEYTPAWAPSTDKNKPLVIGRGILGWIVAVTWIAPPDTSTRCPGGTSIVQVVQSFKHTWLRGLDPGTLAAAQSLYPDDANVVDQPTGSGDPTYQGSLRILGFGLGSADVTGINAKGAQLLAKLEGKFETCVVCKPGWEPVSCVRWGFTADFTHTPPNITDAGLEKGAGTPRFQQVVQEYLHK